MEICEYQSYLLVSYELEKIQRRSDVLDMEYNCTVLLLKECIRDLFMIENFVSHSCKT